MKNYYVWFITIALLMICILFAKTNGWRKNTINDTQYVDQMIETTLTDTVYENLSVSEKKDVIFHLLLRLKKDKHILNFSYDEVSQQFSFMYSDKSLGGIKLNKLNSKLGDIPINGNNN